MTTKQSNRVWLAATVSFLGLSALWPASAQAQTAGATSIAAVAPQPVQEEQSSQIEDVVVVAQRRAERVQDVPISITAVTAGLAESLRVVDTSSIQKLTPGLQLTRSGSGGTTFIRGIGNPSGAAGDEGASAYYVDGVYISNLFANLFSFNNIERIEVLKGPQGTLFGRNASGGVIHVITRRPSDTPVFDTTIGYGNYETVRANTYVSGPLSSTVSASLAGTYSDQGEGWGKSLVTGEDAFFEKNYGLQGKLLWEPTDRTSLTLSALHVFGRTDIGPGLRLTQDAVSAVQPAATYPGFYNTNGNRDYLGRRRTNIVSATLVQDLGIGELTAVGAYQKTRNLLLNDIDATPTDFVGSDVTSGNETWTGEVRLASPSSAPFTWLVGAFFLHDDVSQVFFTRGAAVAPSAYTDLRDQQVTDSYSAFGQVTVPVFERTNVTAGLRYSVDDRAFEGGTDNVSPAGVVTPRVPFRTDDVSYSSWTWRAAIDHKFTDDILGYASYSRGFKSGLYNLNAPQDPPVEPQTVDTAEIGLKSEFFDRRLQFNVAAFHNAFDDIQLRSSVQAPVSRLLNAAKATSQGIDVSVSAYPTDGLRVFAAFEVLDAKYDKFDALFPFTYPRPAVCPPAQMGTTTPGQTTGTPTGGNLTCFGSPDGFDMIQSPPFTGNIGATYEMNLAAGRLVFSGNYSYNAGFFWEADNRLEEPSFGTFDGSIALTSPDDRWTATIWARNLNDAQYDILKVGAATGDIAGPAAPRTFGFDLRFRYGG